VLEGMYTAAAGMAAQQDRLDAVAGDLANVSTTGYKHARLAFRDLVYSSGGHGNANVRLGSGAAATSLARGSAQGALNETGEPLDVALQGQGFIAVRTAAGKPALTRDGTLRLDDRGRLTTATGQLLDPPITVPRGTQPADVKIAGDGTVSVAGRKAGAIRIVTVPAPGGLAGSSDNLFLATAASGAPTAAPRTTRVTQGALEASNVDVGEAMTSMIEAQRGFELASKAIEVQDQMLQIANQVKR
jgi:flagellar basal-body rod protein FlgG